MFQLPTSDCPLCPRLAAFRHENRKKLPQCFNAPVPSFGSLDAQLLVVGLAPGLKGANCSGRPFTGDYAGIILYNALLKGGFAKGKYDPDSFFRHPGEGRDPRQAQNEKQHVDASLRGHDNLELINCRITNAVRCLPPQNKPEPEEIKTCNAFLIQEIAAMKNLKLILSLGLISHNAVLRALGQKLSSAKFGHGAIHEISVPLLNSYHTSRYNINTGALTVAMFDQIIKKAGQLLEMP